MRYFQNNSIDSLLYRTDDDVMTGDASSSGPQLLFDYADRRDLLSNRFTELTRDEYTECLFLKRL